jgi:hypothetical protein
MPTNVPNLHQQEKKSEIKQPVAPPDAPPYREAISGRKQELDQEATFQAVVVVCLDNVIPDYFVRRSSSSFGLSYTPTKTNNAEHGTSRAHMWAHFRAWEVWDRGHT